MDFEQLSANVDVVSVQHESVTLPEQILDIPLIDLWPTVKQQEICVNAASTAEFIDLLRYKRFYCFTYIIKYTQTNSLSKALPP